MFKTLRQGLASRPQIIDAANIPKVNSEQDYYVSLYNYNQDQIKRIEELNSTAGIKDVKTNILYFDFDSEADTELARGDAVELASRLVEAGFNEDSISAYFTGAKGYAIEVLLNEMLSVDEFKTLTFELAKHLETFDKKVNDPSRIIRVVNTKHPKTGLYKIPLELWELDEKNTNLIKTWAKTQRHFNKTNTPSAIPKASKELIKLNKTKTSSNSSSLSFMSSDVKSLNWANKPKNLSNCRFALQNGFFKAGVGIRNNVFLCLASTYKNLQFDQEIVYRMLKGVAELQAKRNDCERYSDNELYNNIILQVFSPTWNNGQFSCKTEGWLKDYCTALGTCSCSNQAALNNQDPHKINDLSDGFKHYINAIDDNTILTGIKTIDDNVFLSTGANVGIIAAPGGGKTSLALNILNHTSKAGVKTVFASLDMHKNRMFEKVMQKVAGGIPRDDLYQLFLENKEAPLLDKVKEEFGNVFFYSKSSPTVQDIREYILECQEKCGEKIKLVMLDYFERVSSDFSDDTQASKKVAGELQDLVNDLDICLVTLVQPNKFALSGGPDVPIMDYTRIKGSSFLYQSFRVILSLWRPFYTPKLKKQDRYMQMAVLKNDMGELNEFAFNWHGPSGTISELEDFQKIELDELLRQKEADNAKDKNVWD